MNDRVDVDDLLDRFREWLDSARAEQEGEGSVEAGTAGESEAAREFGIIDLVEEFTALRHEVKLQTKSGRGLAEQTETALQALKQAIEQFRSVVPKEAQAAWTAGKALAEGLADLDEALDRGAREIERARRQIAERSPRVLEDELNELHRGKSWIRRRLLHSYHSEIIAIVRRDGATRHELFESFLEGYGLIQKRLRRVMAAEQVQQIPCEGLAVDPELMTVLEVVDVPDRPAGTVIKELRRGYTWKGRVIRYAEVEAARTGLRFPDASEAMPASERAADVRNSAASHVHQDTHRLTSD
jgi:molecular chaperone GrpE